MARQKVEKEKVQRQVLAAAESPGPVKPDGQSELETPSDDESSSDSSDAQFAELNPSQIFELGEKAEKAKDIESAIYYFQQAIRKYVNQGNEEVSEGAADFWLAYGDALLTKEEFSKDLFSPDDKEDGEDDDRKIAWESLDIARLCFEKKLERLKTHRVEGLDERESIDIWKLRMDEAPWKPRTFEDGTVLKTLKNAVFTRLRLGDFCQAHYRYDDACEELMAGLRLCVQYALPWSEGLQLAVPLAHCYVVLADDLALQAFQLSVCLVDAELTLGDKLTEVRRKTLQEFRPDLLAQREDYIKGKREMKEEARKAIENVALNLDDKPAVDLGRVGKSRKRAGDA